MENEELAPWYEKLLVGLKRATDSSGIKEGLKNKIRANQLFRNQQEAIKQLKSVGDVNKLKEALAGRKLIIDEITKLDDSDPIRRFAGNNKYLERGLKMLPKTVLKAGYAFDTLLDKELSPIEKVIDASMTLNTPLFVVDRASEQLTGKNLREGFTESGVTDLPPEYFASQYVSF